MAFAAADDGLHDGIEHDDCSIICAVLMHSIGNTIVDIVWMELFECHHTHCMHVFSFMLSQCLYSCVATISLGLVEGINIFTQLVFDRNTCWSIIGTQHNPTSQQRVQMEK